jgi:hypothetical protein
MAFKTFADGNALPAADLNTYLMGQAVVKATSSTRPSSPTEGSAVYETDTDKLVIYTTATTGWVPPWNLPWGVVAYASTTTPQASISSIVDVTGLTATATVVANRRLRVTAWVPFTGSAADAYFAAYVVQASTNLATGYACTGATAAGGAVLQPSGLYVTTAGSVTWKAQMALVSGTGTATTLAGATNPCYLLVEDIGPSAAPA